MAQPGTVDIDALLQPISGDSATGVDIRLDSSPASPYYKVKDARAAARAAERANVEDTSVVPEEWRVVVATALDILSNVSKDIEIAAWLTEGLVRLHGFAGVRDGFKLIGGLADAFWDGLFPMPDEDGIATRLAAVTGLNGEGADGTLILPMRNVPVTEGSERSFAYWQFEQANQVEKIAEPDKKAARLADGAVSMDAFVGSVRETPSAFFGSLVSDIEAAQQAFADMNASLERHAGAADAPPSGKIRDTLEEIVSAIRFFAADKLAAAQTVAATDDGVSAGEAGVQASGAAPAARVREGYETREQAFSELAKIADFFRRIEPHSPISYTLDEVVRRGRMTLPELLSELIQDEGARRLFLLSSGIKPPEAQEG